MSTEARSPKDVLISGKGILVLGIGAVLVLFWLYASTRDRAAEAALVDTSSISLRYLRIAMDEAPQDRTQRLSYVTAALNAGKFDEARAALSPLITSNAAATPELRDLELDLEWRAYVAVPEEHAPVRERARARYVGALTRAASGKLTPEERVTYAHRAESVGATELSERLWMERVTVERLIDDEALAQATAGALGKGEPLQAARVYELAAQQREGAQASAAALRALELARSADQPAETYAMFQRLRPRFEKDEAVLRAGLMLADAQEDSDAGFELAEALLSLDPEDPARHAELARRAGWKGLGARQLDEQVWLAEHVGGEHRGEALRTARARADYATELRLLGEPVFPMDKKELVARLAIHEALGQPEQALALLSVALEGPHGKRAYLWVRRVALELAVDDVDAALVTLKEMDERFGESPERTERRAQLLLRLGRGKEALERLADVGLSPESDYDQLARIGALAFALADSPTARRAYGLAVDRTEATEQDFLRLHALLHADALSAEALALSRRGLARFDTLNMFALAFEDALSGGHDELVEQLLGETEAPDHPLYYDPRFVAMRISSLQQRAHKAREQRAFDPAIEFLAQARTELARPDVRAIVATHDGSDGPSQQLADLEKSQRREELGLALDTGDNEALAELYPELEASLTPAERVSILHRLDRDVEALDVALDALGEAPPEQAEARAQLERDANHLADGMPRLAGGQLGLSDYGELSSWWGAVDAEMGWRGAGVDLRVRFDKLVAEDGANVNLDSGTNELRVEVGGYLRRGAHKVAARVGVDTRDGRSARPYMLVRETATLGERGVFLEIGGAVNEVATDSAPLRADGVRDDVHASALIPVAKPLSVSLSASAVLWSDRNRNILGSGATGEAALIYHVLPREDVLRLDLSALARVAPRYSREDQSGGGVPVIPDSTTWLGSGVALAYGGDASAPAHGRRTTFLLNASVGWLVPQMELGYYTEGGLGFSVFGSDSLALKGYASNVVGNSPGIWVYGTSLSYTHSLW